MAKRVVWKYTLETRLYQSVQIPRGAQLLDVQTQKPGFMEEICVWALVDPNQPLEDRMFHIIGTGMDTEVDGEEYLGTVQIHSYVWHVFVQPIM